MVKTPSSPLTPSTVSWSTRRKVRFRASPKYEMSTLQLRRNDNELFKRELFWFPHMHELFETSIHQRISRWGCVNIFKENEYRRSVFRHATDRKRHASQTKPWRLFWFSIEKKRRAFQNKHTPTHFKVGLCEHFQREHIEGLCMSSCRSTVRKKTRQSYQALETFLIFAHAWDPKCL